MQAAPEDRWIPRFSAVALGGCPVFDHQVRNSSELPRLVRNQLQGQTASMRSGKQVVGSDHHPTYLQLGTNLRIMRGRFIGEIENLDTTQKGVEGGRLDCGYS